VNGVGGDGSGRDGDTVVMVATVMRKLILHGPGSPRQATSLPPREA
jgi:hypothetical protein